MADTVAGISGEGLQVGGDKILACRPQSSSPLCAQDLAGMIFSRGPRTSEVRVLSMVPTVGIAGGTGR